MSACALSEHLDGSDDSGLFQPDRKAPFCRRFRPVVDRVGPDGRPETELPDPETAVDVGRGGLVGDLDGRLYREIRIPVSRDNANPRSVRPGRASSPRTVVGTAGQPARE
ncbi:hypothetical protein KM295_14460 [Natronomonas sp. F2-12]|jgi:hypothetical protein|uniref:Uncharacterized protein n=1 Tax=Natronomonas aquatica TaxID=2841590 RepID=A0A9R1D7E4_9EURY|nr:hypothetical protein [Natronomonas aquatica]MCQ4334657.1 hypothetical protein [Natronomonas aquatica]